MHYYHSPLECIYLVFYEQPVSLQENLWGKNCFFFSWDHYASFSLFSIFLPTLTNTKNVFCILLFLLSGTISSESLSVLLFPIGEKSRGIPSDAGEQPQGSNLKTFFLFFLFTPTMCLHFPLLVANWLVPYFFYFLKRSNLCSRPSLGTFH